MKNIYDRLMGNKEIEKYAEDWSLYQKGQSKMLSYHIIGVILTSILAYFLPAYQIVVALPTILLATLLARFGEYKGYNECLSDLESE